MNEELPAGEIQVLEGLEAVRKRPSMYIGGISSQGLHHLVYEIVDNAVDEALAGFCTEIDVIIQNDGSVSVMDNGRGIPVSIQMQKGIPAVEVVFTILHAGGKFNDSLYKVSGGLHGVGAAVVNALSEFMLVEVYIDGKIHQMELSRGDITKKLEVIGDTDKRGSFVHFKPDTEIFETVDYEFDVIRKRLQETAFLTKNLRINLTDKRVGQEASISFHYEGGIVEFVEHINRSKTALDPKIFYVEKDVEGVMVEIALQYHDGYQEATLTFANNINTSDGGTHLVGFRGGLTRTINEYARKHNILKEDDQNLSGDDVREGLTAIISIKLSDPQFEGQTKARLGNSEARGAVESLMNEYFMYFLEENPKIAKSILDQAMLARQAREAAKKARELVRRKSGLENSRLPGKLTDCSERDPSLCEIFIVEGNSAGGTAKQARNPDIQAILPLRGKIINVEKARIDRVLGNVEIQSMITAFGTGIHDEFNLEKLRYHKIVLMTDADVDGAHIRTLLLTFLYRYMGQLIEAGHIYIAQPPLYKIEKRKKIYYAYSDQELEEILTEIGRDGIKPLQRYKGLGEMNFDQLWDTTMDPEQRILLQVTMKDAISADRIFSELMGDQVEPRREFIETHGKYVTQIDV